MTRRRKFLLYSAFASFCFWTAMYFTFPWDVLGRRLEAEAAQRGLTVVINEIGPALPIGLRVARVVVEKPGAGGESGVPVHIDRLRVTPSLLRTLTFRPALAFEVDALDGHATGTFHASRKAPALDLKFNGIDLGSPTVTRLSGVELGGLLGGEVNLSLDPAGSVTKGRILAHVDGGALKKGKAMGFELPPIDLGSPEVNITVDEGQATIEKLEARSGDVEIEVNGTVALKQRFDQSVVKGSARIQLTDAWLNRNPTIKGLLSVPGIPFRKPDGAFEIPLNGPLTRPASFSLPGPRR